jgi:hypothetical protein
VVEGGSEKAKIVVGGKGHRTKASLRSLAGRRGGGSVSKDEEARSRGERGRSRQTKSKS